MVIPNYGKQNYYCHFCKHQFVEGWLGIVCYSIKRDIDRQIVIGAYLYLSGM